MLFLTQVTFWHKYPSQCRHNLAHFWIHCKQKKMAVKVKGYSPHRDPNPK